MKKCGNTQCQWRKYCADISGCVHWVDPDIKMKTIKVAEKDYDKVIKILKEKHIEFK